MSNRYCYHLVPASKQPQNLYDIYLMLYVQSWTPDDVRKDRPKHVVLLQNKFEKLVHLIQINHQPDATIFFQFIILTFIYSSACFGRFPAHHQELHDRSGSCWFYLHIVVTVVLCSWSDSKLKNCCIWLVIYLNCTMVHLVGFTIETKWASFSFSGYILYMTSIQWHYPVLLIHTEAT